MNSEKPKIVGLIPAAGNASRLSPIPCSKEIFPIGLEKSSYQLKIKVAVSDLLGGLAAAGAEQIFMILRKGKWDIPQYLGVGLHPQYTLSYIITEPTGGTHYTIDLAYQFVKDKTVLLGFPDILFNPQHAFIDLLKRQEKSGAEVVLGLFKTGNPGKADMVEIDEHGRVKEIIIKPANTSLKYCWTMAVWSPVFTEYLHNFITETPNAELQSVGKEIYIGNVIQQAMADGLTVEGVQFPDGNFIDIGTFKDLKQVWNNEL